MKKWLVKFVHKRYFSAPLNSERERFWKYVLWYLEDYIKSIDFGD